MFVSRPGRTAACAGPRLIRAARATFTGPAAFLADQGRRADVGVYLADLTRPFGIEPHSELCGQSYGEMAAALVAAVMPAAEAVELLVLAFSIHDMWPGRATAAYLSRVCPGTPMSFAVCDQGRAAAFTGLRLIRDYRPHRALLIVVEQSALPYDSPATPPAGHRGVAMLYGDGPGAEVTGIHQHPGVAPGSTGDLVAGGIAELSDGHGEVRVVLGDGVAATWPEHPGQVAVPPGQPVTGVWWQLAEELNGPADLVVVADYDPDLRTACLVGFAPRSSAAADCGRLSRSGGWRG